MPLNTLPDREEQIRGNGGVCLDSVALKKSRGVKTIAR